MMSLLDTLYQILFSPSEGLRKVTGDSSILWSAITSVFISMVFALIIIASPNDFTRVIFQFEKEILSFVPAVILWMVIFLLVILLSSGVYHLVARLCRGRGSYVGMACGLSFAVFPLIFFAPLTLLRALLGFIGACIYNFLAIAVFFWILVLIIIAIRHNYKFKVGKVGKANVVYLIPAATVVVAILVAGIITMIV
jgi:hypothetical protein